TAKETGFCDGDILLTADDIPLVRYDADMLRQIVDARIVTVLREGRQAQIYIPDNMMQKLMADSIRFASYGDYAATNAEAVRIAKEQIYS
ncbi:hypothetical protein EZS27_039500, partial [termite gut metagenome]